MSSYFKAHRVLALIVLCVAGGWVATGEFAAVGSAEEKPAEAEAASPAPQVLRRTVAVVKPEFIQHAREIRISGSTTADKSVVLAARANGIVASLGVSQGAEVATDALVLQLEGADVTASVTTALAALDEATERLDVGEKLFAKGSLPELERTSRRAAKVSAEAALSQAQAAADRLMLKAPFSGIVDSVEVEVGEWVTAGAPITTILSLDPIVVTAEVSELDVPYVAAGAKAKVRLVDGTEMEGTVRHVSRQASEETRTFAVEVALPNADHKIAAGLTAELRLFAPAEPAVVVPRSIITMSDAGEIGLRVLGADDIARFAPVTLIDDTEAGLIVMGVPQDVRVIVAGQDLVRDGDPVTAVDVPADLAAKAAP